MKMNSYIICTLIAVFSLLRPELVLGQQQKPDTSSVVIQRGVVYIFRPQMVYPVSSSARQLSAGFELRFSKDSIFCYLPYYGIAYNAAYGSNNDLLHFSTADFGYKEQLTPKGDRVIVLKPKNRKEIREMNITLYQGGEAYVWITFSQRQNIAYRGPVLTEP